MNYTYNHIQTVQLYDLCTYSVFAQSCQKVLASCLGQEALYELKQVAKFH
jgi:hypothetical protein